MPSIVPRNVRTGCSEKNSDLVWTQAHFAAGAGLEMDKSTPQHRRYANGFGIDDINGPLKRTRRHQGMRAPANNWAVRKVWPQKP